MDGSSDGSITSEEFHEMMSRNEVKDIFNLLDMDVHEAVSLFNLLDDGDGCMQQDEFLTGIMRLKGHARSQDIVILQRDCRRIDKQCKQILDLLTQPSAS